MLVAKIRDNCAGADHGDTADISLGAGHTERVNMDPSDIDENKAGMSPDASCGEMQHNVDL